MAQPARHSGFSPPLRSFAGTLWIGFLVVSIVVTVVWAFDLGEAQINQAIKARELRAALLWLVGAIDVIWLILASMTLYSSLAQNRGLSVARRSTALIISASWIFGTVSAWSGWPFGKLHFTERLGFLIGTVSVGWLLIWCVLVLGSRELLLGTLPRGSHSQVSLLTGLLTSAANINLEPLAWKTRAWWLWTNSAAPSSVGPLQSHVAWFVLSAALAWCLPTPILNTVGSPRVSKAALVFLILQAMLLLAHLGRFLRA